MISNDQPIFILYLSAYGQIQCQRNLQCLDIEFSGEGQIHSLNPHHIYKCEGVRGSKKLEYWWSLKYFYINCEVAIIGVGGVHL